MALSVKQLIDKIGDKYQLHLVAGEKNTSVMFTWVHMLEDTSVADFFWGNEIIVTSGLMAQDEDSLLQMIRILDQHRAAALVINIGKYIHEIPPRVIRYCEEENLPLLTMPWHMSMVDFVRAACTALTQSMVSEDDLARAVILAVTDPLYISGYHSQLAEYFNEEDGFRMLAIRVKTSHTVHTAEMIQDQRSILRLHSALRGLSVPYLIFRNEKRIFVLLNTKDKETASLYSKRMYDNIHLRLPDCPLHIGIGDTVDSLTQLVDCYHSALSAQRCASLQEQDIIWFSDMSFYRLLYSLPNEDLLRTYYYDTIGCLLDFDAEHHTNLLDTLFCWLMNDCSPQTVAAKMYTHRNTINYRMGKIREITGCNFDNPERRLPYMIAYHIKQILKL